MDTVDIDWLEIERASFETARQFLAGGFDVFLDHTWFAYIYRLLGTNPETNILHTHLGGLFWTPYGSPEYPKYLQSTKFNLIAISNFMKRVYKYGVFKQPDGKKVGLLNFDSEVAYNGIDLVKYRYREEKGDRLLLIGRLDDF